MKKVLVIFILIVLAYNLIFIYIDSNIKNKDISLVYDNCRKTWSARGFYTTKETQNSIESVNQAFQNGNLGVEVDIYYDVKMQIFIVSHDKPYINPNGNLQYTLKNNKLLTLEELLIKTGKEKYFWLDYKNLDRLSAVEMKQAIKRLDAISQIYNIKERLYIEGSNPLKLSEYTKNGFKTIFAFSPLKESSVFSSISSNIYKIAYYFFDLSAIAMPYGKLENPKYNEVTQSNLKGIPTFLFHVPDDAKLLNELINNDDVRVMLIGRDKSLNRADINNCQDKLIIGEN